MNDQENKDLDSLFGDDDKQEPHDKQDECIVQKEDIVANNPCTLNSALSIDPKLSNFAPGLSNEQQLAILKAWDQNQDDPPSIEELLKIAYPDSKIKLDGRSREGRLVKSYLATKDLKSKTKTEYIKKEFLDLTNEEQEFIKNNSNMRGSEIASAIWNKPYFANNSQEVRTILNYQKELEKEGNYKKLLPKGQEEAFDEYRPPKTFDHTVARVNKYIRDSELNNGALNAAQKKCCKMLISYLHSYRLNHQINSFSKQTDRDLFESVFVSYCYDKPDLTREDIDKMVILATESVISANKLRMIELLQNEMQKSLDENNNVKVGIVDSISTINTEYNSSVKRQRDLYNDLNEKRSERLKGKLKETASVLNLVELWKNEETRNKMIKIANQRKEKLKEEIDRLSNMDDLVGMIAGLDKSEVLNN